MKIQDDNRRGDQIRSIYKNVPKDLICFSHLRWDFVFQRPQHLLTRFARVFQVHFVEEPIFDSDGVSYYEYLKRGENITVMVPHLKPGLEPAEVTAALKDLFSNFMDGRSLADLVFWYYTPMALEFTRKYSPEVLVFDCMDELSAFKFAPEKLKTLEKELLSKADVVFTGGYSLYEAKKNQHANIYAYPSSIEKEHFMHARELGAAPGNIKQPKLGFYGVIDERFDIRLIAEVADARPDWQLYLIGPVVKVDPAALPQNANIHYLGPKQYSDLPKYLAEWDIAMIPFAINESTRFISPTKTPEYLAAGKPVISTPIKDVIDPYGRQKLVHIAANAEEFIKAAEQELSVTDKTAWLNKVDTLLAKNSWDETCSSMLGRLQHAIKTKVNTSIAQ